MKLLEFYRKNMPGFEDSYLAATAPQIGMRETRRIMGEYVLTQEDILRTRDFPDTVARGVFPIDIHSPEGGWGRPIFEEKDETGAYKDRWDVLKEGTSYGIPYRCLVPKKIDNLLVAGRCISGTHEAHGSYRVMSHCMALGQAAGTAAALAIKNKVSPRKIDIKLLQEKLLKANVYLGR